MYLLRPSSTKMNTYCTLNPELTVHGVYNTARYIPDHLRIAFSQFRLTAHHLKVETGRWSRKPREKRLCSCNINAIQNEDHVIFNCPLSKSVRERYQIASAPWEEFFNHNLVCEIIYSTMKMYNHHVCHMVSVNKVLLLLLYYYCLFSKQALTKWPKHRCLKSHLRHYIILPPPPQITITLKKHTCGFLYFSI